MPFPKWPLILKVGVLTGLINGLLGIGGGTILIPAMVLFMGLSQHQAHGTSLAIIMPTALVSTLVYGFHGSVDLILAIKIAATGMLGGYLGAKLMIKIPDNTLKRIFGVFLLIIGIRMVI